ncbi:hypothetical protein PFISCL1PPCAC_26303, partial [Pristionchus fissidentatus]
SQNQLSLVALCTLAFSAYAITPCEDFCAGVVLGTSEFCWCNINFHFFNRTCYQKCIANCAQNGGTHQGCIPLTGQRTVKLWQCCITKPQWISLSCDGECWTTAVPSQLSLVALCTLAFSAYAITPCEDFCAGVVLGTSEFCWCNINFHFFNRTCYQKCIANCAQNGGTHQGCIPLTGQRTVKLWQCCITKPQWISLSCDGECWTTAVPSQLSLVALCTLAFSAYAITPCEDFCAGVVLGTSEFCWCNINFHFFNRTCYQKCIANCAQNGGTHQGCIPLTGQRTVKLWQCCITKPQWISLSCDGECWTTAVPSQLSLVALCTLAFSAYAITPCEDFCAGVVLGTSEFCWCNINFHFFNRTCYQKCIANCAQNGGTHQGCIPLTGQRTVKLWQCCITKPQWISLSCDGECWTTAVPSQLSLVALCTLAFSAYAITPCEDFCAGVVLGTSEFCWCNINFHFFNRTCYQKCIANCAQNGGTHQGCIPLTGQRTVKLWQCCITKPQWISLSCDGECWTTAVPSQLSLVALCTLAFSAYAITPCEDFCAGVVLGTSEFCWCNINFHFFNRTCYQKCIANCAQNGGTHQGCIPLTGQRTVKLWQCCITKPQWISLSCDGECWTTAVPSQLSLVALCTLAFSAYAITPCEDFCAGVVLGTSEFCWCNINFHFFNRTCYQKCIANCAQNGGTHQGCIPLTGQRTVKLWQCCITKPQWISLSCDGECWTTAVPSQLSLVALCTLAFSAYAITPCEDFCAGVVLGTSEFCWCNINFHFFNRTCYQKCIANCAQNGGTHQGCIPLTGQRTVKLWQCCITKPQWISLSCDGECWTTAVPSQLSLVALCTLAFSAYAITPCEDFCAGVVLGTSEFCWCNINFHFFNRTCYQKCIANCAQNGGTHQGCIPLTGQRTVKLWQCCITKPQW